MAEMNVVAVSYPQGSTAYQALSELKRLASAQRVRVIGAVVVERDDGERHAGVA